MDEWQLQELKADVFRFTKELAAKAGVPDLDPDGVWEEVQKHIAEPLEYEGTVLAFQVTTLARERLEDCAGELTAEQMRDVDRAVATSFGLAGWGGE